MASIFPVVLQGTNLGERHRYLNSLVWQAFLNDFPIDSIIDAPECSPVDRLFKIDLASKQKHVEYILHNLRDDDMLYVTRALKSTWLLGEKYRYAINPDYLETVLYPKMLTTAVNKMKHWIYLNLRDPLRSLEFFKYYSTKDIDYGIKFLSNCPYAVVLKELKNPEILEMITPHRLKVLCEKVPSTAKLFYEMLTQKEVPTSLVKVYVGKEQEFFNSIKCVLKKHMNYAVFHNFLDLAEQFFPSHSKRLSAKATKYVMIRGKDRVMRKAELYIAQILDVGVVARFLTPYECEHLVIRLAQAHYLRDDWFNYENIQLLLTRLDVPKRKSLHEKIFIDNDIGECVMKWPYDPPSLLELEIDDTDIFLERKETNNFERPLKRPKLIEREDKSKCSSTNRDKPLFDLFEKYRYLNFYETLSKLREKIISSSMLDRMYIFLLLITKSRKRTDTTLNDLFNLLLEYKDDPSVLRSVIVRNLVIRVCVWRVNDDNWKRLLIYSQGLGLDGNIPEAECKEGLDVVVIRALLSNRDCETAVKAAFLKNFTTLSCYSFTKAEKEHVKEALLTMLVEYANAEVDPEVLGYAIDTLQAYKIKFESRPELAAIIRKIYRHNPSEVDGILKHMFVSKLGRKEMYKENFEFIQTDASYLNALKHDITILSVDKFIEALVFNNMDAEQFLRKISIYFNGNEDLAGNLLIAIKETNSHKKLVRPITYLIGDGLKSYMLHLDSKVECQQFSALVRANAHVARPAFDLDSIEWQMAGAKLIANRVIICRQVDIMTFIEKLLTWKNTARLAIILAQRTEHEAVIFDDVAKITPLKALKTALTYFREKGDQSDRLIWEVVKPLIVKVTGQRYLVRKIRKSADSIPASILPEYLPEAFKVINAIDFNMSLDILWRIKNILPEIDEMFISDVLKDFLENQLVLDKIQKIDMAAELYLSILGKHLLLCKTEDAQTTRFESIGQLYLDRFLSFWESGDAKTRNKVLDYLEVISKSLRYTEIYLSNEYVSCIPVIERFMDWMGDVILFEKHIIAFMPFHLNIMYYNTIREVVEAMPGVLDNKERHKEGYKLFGETFGKFIAQEARNLKNDHFDSIVLIYSRGLGRFFRNLNNNRDRVAPYIIAGIINATTGIECILALTIIENKHKKMNAQENEYIQNCFRGKNSMEMRFFYSWNKNKCWDL